MHQRRPRELRIIGRRVAWPEAAIPGRNLDPSDTRSGARDTVQLDRAQDPRPARARPVRRQWCAGARGTVARCIRRHVHDSDARAVQALRERLAEFGAHGGQVLRAEAQQFLAAGLRRVSAAAPSAAAAPAAGAPPPTRLAYDLISRTRRSPPGLLALVAQRSRRDWLAPQALVLS